MTYTGEHLLPGQIGHLAIVLSFVSSLLATLTFAKANSLSHIEEKKSWTKFARSFFLIETIAVITVISLLIYMLAAHLFEYKYVWTHSDKTLQPEYLLSCLWEGQEGSFLLWTFWHCVLGWVVIKRGGKWEAPVMMVISFAQVCLATMVLGVYLGDNIRIGSNPFLLSRVDGLFDMAPMFKDADGNIKADYMNFVRDGSGLNATLQNYWMVIHPPILFLGFASTIVPFAYAFAGLVNKDHTWTKSALPFASFSGGILGLGIMMGAAWAYESLNFGGYWAWDPVENASLVPWLVMVAGIHTNLVFNKTEYSLKSTYLFYILSFSLILYSTYLTRSGALGDTSVHAFTGADMDVQLISFILVFFIPGMVLFFMRLKNIPSIQKEENTYSREFWMFIGSLVLFLSAVIIIGKTSFPIINKIFGTKIAKPEDPEFSYNQIQIFIAIVIGLLSGVGQFLKYKDTPKKYLIQKLLQPTIIALAVAVLISLFVKIDYPKKGIAFQVALYIGLFMAVFTVVANIGYVWIVLKGKVKASGASVAHIGFGLVLVGVLLSAGNKKVLSNNTTGISLFEKTKQEDPAENITLFKGMKTDMGKYHVTFVGDSLNTKDRKQYFQIDFEGKNKLPNFTLYPDLIKNNKGAEGMGANPDKEHYWNKDIFIYVSAYRKTEQDTARFLPANIKIGDSIFYSNGYMILNKVDVDNGQSASTNPNAMKMGLDMTVISKEGSRYPLHPYVEVSSETVQSFPDTVNAQGLIVQFNKLVDDKKHTFEIGIKENRSVGDTITLKVLEFPFINVLWIGVIVTVIGFFMSIGQYTRPKKVA
ncbi:MAG: cytochrome c assembly protein [Pseudopedobacter saltans]|uniref:Cytochrome c assembly protein n=1 Tax=Pseudopedobacter saltans TaxID=151895 RepID=A0A2W5HAA9_9SPHI|nr:MAG: cytochrome c assembly protein [Pseudopedobacter saltans]